MEGSHREGMSLAVTHGNLDGALIQLNFRLDTREQGTRRDDLDVRELDLLGLLEVIYLDI